MPASLPSLIATDLLDRRAVSMQVHQVQIAVHFIRTPAAENCQANC